MHHAKLKNKDAFNVLVDVTHEFMNMSDWDNSKAVNKFRFDALLKPKEEIDTYWRAYEFIKTFPYLKEYSDKLYNILKEV